MNHCIIYLIHTVSLWKRNPMFCSCFLYYTADTGDVSGTGVGWDGMGSNQCQFLSYGCRIREWFKRWKIHRILLYSFSISSNNNPFHHWKYNGYYWKKNAISICSNIFNYIIYIYLPYKQQKRQLILNHFLSITLI